MPPPLRPQRYSVYRGGGIGEQSKAQEIVIAASTKGKEGMAEKLLTFPFPFSYFFSRELKNDSQLSAGKQTNCPRNLLACPPWPCHRDAAA